MPSNLFTNGQLRWALHILLACLSLVGICVLVPHQEGSARMFTGSGGDVKGPTVLLSGVGLAGVMILRLGYMILPRPWRIYLDRLEFAFISLLWIGWTSATLGFTAFAITTTICAQERKELYLPTCPIMTFDLTLLHLLSTATLALMLVILSTALAPGYLESLSVSLDGIKKDIGEEEAERDVFVMWDLAVSVPLEQTPGGPNRGGLSSKTMNTTYGTTQYEAGNIGNPYALEVDTGNGDSSTQLKPVQKDKFQTGRRRYYIPLILCSIGVGGASAWAMSMGDFVWSIIFVNVVAGVSFLFCTAFLFLPYWQRINRLTPEKRYTIQYYTRSLEVSILALLFLLWPISAIAYTLYPSSPDRACQYDHPTSEAPLVPDDLPGITMCSLSSSIIALSWMGAWIILFRLMGLTFPLNEISTASSSESDSLGEGEGERGRGIAYWDSGLGIIGDTAGGGERAALLGGTVQSPLRSASSAAKGKGKGKGESAEIEVVRPQVKYGRIVAGEAFELGGDEDEDDE